jgi:hypothetical protein
METAESAQRRRSAGGILEVNDKDPVRHPALDSAIVLTFLGFRLPDLQRGSVNRENGSGDKDDSTSQTLQTFKRMPSASDTVDIKASECGNLGSF